MKAPVQRTGAFYISSPPSCILKTVMQSNNRPSTKGQSRKTESVGNVAFLARCVKEDQLHTGMMRDLSQRFRLPQDPTAYPLTIEGVTILAPINTAPILIEDKERLPQTA